MLSRRRRHACILFTWELPKSRGPNIDFKDQGSDYEDAHKKDSADFCKQPHDPIRLDRLINLPYINPKRHLRTLERNPSSLSRYMTVLGGPGYLSPGDDPTYKPTTTWLTLLKELISGLSLQMWRQV